MQLFDDFFDADEEKQLVVSLNPLPRSGSMDNKTSPFGLEDVFGDDQSSNDEEDEVFASGDIGFTKDAGADPESGSGGDVDCGGYTDAEFPEEHPIDAFIEGDISTVNTDTVHTDVDLVENKQEVKEEEELTKMLVELDAEELLSHEAQAQSASGEGGEADADAKGDVVPDVMVKEVNTEVKEGAEAGVNQSEPETDHANKRQKVE